jgi:hypothetical protein
LPRGLRWRGGVLWISKKNNGKRLNGISLDEIVGTNEEQLIVVFNPAAEKMFRCPATSAVNSPLDKFICNIGKVIADIIPRLNVRV